MADADSRHLVEIALRDSRNLDVIMALDRLVELPNTMQELERATADLKIVRTFVTERLPEGLRAEAGAMFVEHARKIEAHYRAEQQNAKE